MTNEEKANEICKKHIFDSNHFDCCMEMAKWKDEQHKQDRCIIRNHYREWAEEQIAQEKQQLIDDACVWLKNDFTYPTMTQTEINYVQEKIENFKKAMEKL